MPLPSLLSASLERVLTAAAARAFHGCGSVEQVVRSMLSDKSGDAAAVLGSARMKCLYDLAKSGTDDRLVAEWVETTRRVWVERGHPLIRTAMLLHTLITHGDRFLAAPNRALAVIDPAELARRIDEGLALSDEKLEPYEAPPPLPPPARIPPALASLEGYHHFRVDLTSWSGSVSCRESGLFGSIDEVQRELALTMRDRDGLTVHAFNGLTVRLEMFMGGRRVGEWDLRPALSVSVDGERLAFEQVADDVVEAALVRIQGAAHVSCELRLHELDLPMPAGRPLPEGSTARFDVGGLARTHPYGWIVVWNEEWKIELSNAGASAELADAVHAWVEYDGRQLAFAEGLLVLPLDGALARVSEVEGEDIAFPRLIAAEIACALGRWSRCFLEASFAESLFTGRYHHLPSSRVHGTRASALKAQSAGKLEPGSPLADDDLAAVCRAPRFASVARALSEALGRSDAALELIAEADTTLPPDDTAGLERLVAAEPTLSLAHFLLARRLLQPWDRDAKLTAQRAIDAIDGAARVPNDAAAAIERRVERAFALHPTIVARDASQLTKMREQAQRIATKIPKRGRRVRGSERGT